MREFFLRNDGVGLHVVDGGDDRSGVPLLIVPGLAESATDYIDLIEALSPRRCLAVTLRGRNPSGAPATGYALENHVGDVAAAAALLDPTRFCLLASSRGVAYALGYAIARPERLAGLVLADYPARHSELPWTFPASFMATSWRGKPATERIAAHALRALQHESREVSFWNDLGAIDCPTAILHGAPSRGSLLSPSQIDRFRARLRHPTVVGFPASGHDLRSPDPALFAARVRRFLATLDARPEG